jgi:fatty acid desaturase
MAKERAVRRAERERNAALQAQARAREVARGARRRSVVARLRGLMPQRRRRPDSVLARRRRSQNLTVVALLAGVQILVWIGVGSVPVSLWLLVLTVLASPVLLTLIFDRRG